MRRVFLCALTLLMTSCSSEIEAAPEGNGLLEAPTPKDVSQRLVKTDHEGRVEVSVGEVFVIELVGVPTAGYMWDVAQMPAFLSQGESVFGATVKEQSEPGFTGGNHWEVLSFSATKPGKGKLKLVQKREWEDTHVDEFEVTIIAK